MTENIPFCVKFIRSPNLPVELFNEETKEVEVFHMIQKGDTLFISDEFYLNLKRWRDSE